MFEQIAVVTWMNIRNLPQRVWSSLVIVIGIAGVVAVLVYILALSSGVSDAFGRTGRDDVAMVLRAGSPFELSSFLDRDSIHTILDGPGVKLDETGKLM